MPETPSAPFRLFKLLDSIPCSMVNLVYHHLADPVASFNDKGFITKVYHYHRYLSPVIGINGAWRVQKRYPMIYGKTAPGPYLRLKTVGQGYGNPCGHEHPFPRLEGYLSLHICIQVHSCGMRGHISGGRDVASISPPLYLYIYPFHDW